MLHTVAVIIQLHPPRFRPTLEYILVTVWMRSQRPDLSFACQIWVGSPMPANQNGTFTVSFFMRVELLPGLLLSVVELLSTHRVGRPSAKDDQAGVRGPFTRPPLFQALPALSNSTSGPTRKPLCQLFAGRGIGFVG